MDRSEIYTRMAERKAKPKDSQPYQGDNGRVNRCVELFRKGALPKGGVLLDVGGGIGDLAYACREMFDRTLVIDISPLQLRAAETKGIPKSDLYDLDVDQQGFSSILDWQVSVVTALDFIEHIVDPESFARECYRVLEPGGEVFINTPNIQFFPHIEQLTRGRFPHTSGDREVFHGGHLAFYTYLDLCDIFGAAGFEHFRQFKDEEGYLNPPAEWIQRSHPITQQEYVNVAMRFGNPNLLFAATKPD